MLCIRAGRGVWMRCVRATAELARVRVRREGVEGGSRRRCARTGVEGGKRGVVACPA